MNRPRKKNGQFRRTKKLSRISRSAANLGRRSAEVRGLDRMQSDYDERGLAVYQFKSKSGEPPAEDSQPELAPTLSTREMPPSVSPVPVVPIAEPRQEVPADVSDGETPPSGPAYYDWLNQKLAEQRQRELAQEREAHMRLLNPRRQVSSS